MLLGDPIMNCNSVRALLVALQDGELTRSQEDLVAEHLDGCSACQEHLDKLLATTPVAPVIELDAARRHELHLSIDRALAVAALEPAPAPKMSWRELVAGEVPVPRGLLFAYAAALILSIAWAANGSFTPSGEPQVAEVAAAEAVEEGDAVAMQMHRPAAYTPRDGWF
ncbi:MAG: hypothetical protein EA397_20240 [Deltaproteobacteria bacterium]|nr:MAG: hypothetical protein EA397_20240 [Deltaproteobacteria bacterium]